MLNVKKKTLIQDIDIPIPKSAEMLSFIQENICIYPIWICPALDVQHKDKTFYIGNQIKNTEGYLMNMGIYGVPRIKLEMDSQARNRALEQKVKEVGGIKGLYAHIYYTKDEFWSNYNEKDYLKLRQKYHAEGAFLELYEKLAAKS